MHDRLGRSGLEASAESISAEDSNLIISLNLCRHTTSSRQRGRTTERPVA